MSDQNKTNFFILHMGSQDLRQLREANRCVRFAGFFSHWAVIINIRIYCLMIQAHLSLTGRSFIFN